MCFGCYDNQGDGRGGYSRFCQLFSLSASVCAIICNMSLMLPILIAATSALSTNDAVRATNDVVRATNAVVRASTRITAGSTYYDRKEGFAYFNGSVTVEDPQYQLHADRAFVYMGGTNDLRRIVALGNVAITNETRRAYGAKASYYRETGMVVLYSGEGRAAEVRDEKPDGDQVVRGKKIKFWTGTRQVEVIDAEITAPSGGGLDAAGGMLGR